MSDDDLFGTRSRGAPAMGRRGGGERSTERASPALAADFADDASDEETARPPARRSGGWAGEDAAEGIARDFDDASPLRAPMDGGVDGTPGGSASRRRMDSASKHDALEARGGPGPDIPEIPTLSEARAFADGAYADDAADAPEYTAGTNTNIRSIHELNRATFAGGAAEARTTTTTTTTTAVSARRAAAPSTSRFSPRLWSRARAWRRRARRSGSPRGCGTM